MTTLTSPLRIATRTDCLIVRFPGIFECLSWAPWNGGKVSVSAVVNRQVGRQGSCSLDTIDNDFRCLCKEISLPPEETIGLMTAANVGAYQDCFLIASDAWVHVVGTVGLSNTRSVLDDADCELGSRCETAGTVNLVVATNALPGLGGCFEAAHIASAAKTAAFRDMGVKSQKSDRPADVTGTDCLVLAASGDVQENHCGLHTVLGEMIGRAVHKVVSGGIVELRKA